MNYKEENALTSIQKSLTLLTLDEEDKSVFEHVFNNEWSAVRDLVTERGADLSLKLICCICSVGPPQSVIVAIKRANSRIFAQTDDKGRHPLHYLCYYGAPTFAIVYAAQCHIAALEVKDANNKTPLEYLLTLPWEYSKEDKEDVTLELQKCHNLKCFDTKSQLPNQVALERWGYKVVLEERIKCFMVCYIECARFEKVDWDGSCLAQVAEEIKEKCHNTVDELKGDGRVIRIDPYRLFENKFAIVVKTKVQADCEDVYNTLCQKHLGAFKNDGVFLRIGCVYCNGVIGSNSLKELLKEAEQLEDVVKENLQSAALAVSTAMNDVKGMNKINVSPFHESKLNDFAGKKFIPDSAVSSKNS